MANQTVYVLNPPRGLRPYLSTEKAFALADSGKAKFTDRAKTRILLTDAEERTRLGWCAKALDRRNCDANYDSERQPMSQEKLRRIPFVGDVRRLDFVRSR